MSLHRSGAKEFRYPRDRHRDVSDKESSASASTIRRSTKVALPGIE